MRNLKIAFILGLEVQHSPFMYNRIKCYIKHNLDFDIYQPFITRDFNQYLSAKEFFNMNEYGNVDKIVYTPKGMRKGEEQLCFRMFNVIAEYIKGKRYDLIVAHWVYPHGYVAYLLSKTFNIPFIITAHGSDIHTTPYLCQDSQKYREIKDFSIEALNQANGAIFVSNYLKKEAIKLGINNKNVEVIHNGVNCNIFNVIDKNKYKNILGYDINKKYILYAGHLEYIKGSDYLISIYKEITKLEDNIEMFIIGYGELQNNIINAIKSSNLHDKIHLVNFLPQKKLSLYMGISDVLILPSRNEAWGCVVNESLACGTPVVGSNIEGIVESIGGSMYGSVVDHFTEEEFIVSFSQHIVDWTTKKYDRLRLREKAQKYEWDKLCSLEIKFMKDIYYQSSNR